MGGHHADSPAPYRRQVRDRARHAAGLLPAGEGRFAIWAANGGSPDHPAWSRNLKAQPRVTVEVGTQMFTVMAEELDGTARAQLWPKLVAQYPQLGETQAKTTRQFPVFLLTRQD